MKKYILTEEHRKQMNPWVEKWIKNAMSTRKIEDHEIPLIKKHVKGLYEAAGLTPPPDHRIIIVSSPFVARFAGGFAAWIWYCRNKNRPVHDATNAATSASTYDATDAATRDATYDATNAATSAATYDATNAATSAATSAATDAARKPST